ncbi:hypothetical protein CSHISOI_06883 [Colletotrichum shisoi]|uniref:Uncharacterized protein n=1 Tax=Colletotrichum shisoi TaxID=2078593 RepID=A0A5Q4BP96_9PEZI|nr:hypothetical protein CSHISOI_06883 [Colletotrichum shisoi]
MQSLSSIVKRAIASLCPPPTGGMQGVMGRTWASGLACMPWSCFREAASSRTPALDLGLLCGIPTVAPNRRRCRQAGCFNQPTGRLASARVLLLFLFFFFVFVSPTTETTTACKGRIHIVRRGRGGLPGFRGATISARMTSSRLRLPMSSHTQYTSNGRQLSLDLTTLADADSKWRGGPARLWWIGEGVGRRGSPTGSSSLHSSWNRPCKHCLPLGRGVDCFALRQFRNAVSSPDRTATLLLTRSPLSVAIPRRPMVQFCAWHGEAMSTLGFVAQKNKVPTGSRPACRFVQPSNRVAVQCGRPVFHCSSRSPRLHPASAVVDHRKPTCEVLYIYT